MENKIIQLIPDRPNGQDAIIDLRKAIFTNVWKQRKYTNKMSVTSIFYVMVTKHNKAALLSTEYTCHPVFRCKKCDKNSNTSDCCMIYIDETGRVYQNWESYINENVLPAGTMITPRRGIYNFNANGQVILDIYCTPNGTDKAKIIEEVQSKVAVLGLGAAAVPVAGILLPVAAPIMALAAVVGLGVGTFTAITSGLNLSDRKKHDQSVSIGNKEARANYIGLLGGAVGVASFGATRVMTSMASAGKATKNLETLVNGFNLSSVALSGTGVVHGALDLYFKYNDGEKISSMDVLQFSASLVLFTNSINNFQLASQIANNARNNSIKSYRETLSNRQRKMFDKMSKESMRIRGATQGRMDIIRGINEIPDRQYLNDLFKINKKLHQRNIRPSFTESGKDILLNNEMKVYAAELRQSVQHQRGPEILKQVTKPIPSTHNSEVYTKQVPEDVKLFFANGNVGLSVDVNLYENGWESALSDMAMHLSNGATIFFNNYGMELLRNIHDVTKFKDIITAMFENMSQEAAEYVLQLAQTFIEQFKSKIESTIRAIISTESIIYQIVKEVLDKSNDISLKYLSRHADRILINTKKHFLKLNTQDAYGKVTTCPICKGSITVTQL